MQKSLSLLCFLLLALILTGCRAPQDVAYFQDDAVLREFAIRAAQSQPVLLRPGDRLNIVVSSALTPELAAGLNKVQIAPRGEQITIRPQVLAPYILDAESNVILPGLGVVGLKGCSRETAATKIQTLIAERGLLRDANVSIEVLNQYVSVLGEVKTPGRVDLLRDRLTVLEALARCGDLTIDADRKRVTLLREHDGVVQTHTMDLTLATELYASPAYFLEPGDVIYVAPTKFRQRAATGQGNAWSQPGLYISGISVLTSIIALIIAL